LPCQRTARKTVTNEREEFGGDKGVTDIVEGQK
jgi:hypothetical protein